MLTASQEQIDYVNATRVQWYANEARIAGANTNEEVNNFLNSTASLPQYIWKQWDREAVEIQRSVLTIYNDLAPAIGRAIPIGTLQHEFRRITDQEGQGVWSMDGRQRPDADLPLTDYIGTPVPLYANSWGFGWVQMESARANGYNDLDRYGRDNIMRKTAEELEDAILEGITGIKFNETSTVGLLNHPKRRQVTSTVNLRSATGKQWKQEFAKIRKALSDIHQYGGLTLYVNYDDWQYANDTDYTDTYDSPSIAARAMTVDGISQVIPTKNALVPANKIIGIYKSRMTAEILSRMPLTTIPKFRSHPHDDYAFEIWASASLEVKYDINDSVGLVVYTGA